MSNPEMNEPSVPWHERITTPPRVLFQEGFLATWHKHTLFSLVSLSLLAVVSGDRRLVVRPAGCL